MDMPENNQYHQGSFDDGAFVPEAPQQPGNLDRGEVQAAHWAHQAALGGPDNKYDPNSRRAEQTQGVGGGITEALRGELPNQDQQDTQAVRPLRIGSFYDGRPIRNDTELQQAMAKQHATQIRNGKHTIAHQPEEQVKINDRGLQQVRDRLQGIAPLDDPQARSPHIVREGDVAFDPLTELGDEEIPIRRVPNSDSSRRAS